MKEIICTLLLCLILLNLKSQSTLTIGTNTPETLGDGTFTPAGGGDNYTLEIHSTKLNVAAKNSYTYSTQNTAIFNCASYGDNTEMVRFRTNGNSSYFNIFQVASKMRVSFVQAGTTQLYLSENGKIGIGNSAPNALLDVSGNLFLSNNGKLYIGAYDANTITQIANYSLAVNGNAIFNKAKVSLYGNWPDYVFSKDYKLPELDTLEKFIQLNRHLPEMPSASDVKENGIDLGDNQTLLVKKIEELTLLAIDQNKKIENLFKIIDKQMKELEVLKNQIKRTSTK